MNQTLRPMQAGAPPIRQETPADPPLPPQPAPHSTFTPAVWVPFALSVALIIASEILQTLHTFPASQGITIAIAVTVTIYGILAGVQSLLAQHQASEERMQAKAQAHELRMALARRQ